MINVAIDGPAGAGKSTIAKAAAKTLGFIYVDTGALYRTIALSAVRCGADNNEKIINMLNDITVKLGFADDGSQCVYLNGEMFHHLSEHLKFPWRHQRFPLYRR